MKTKIIFIACVFAVLGIANAQTLDITNDQGFAHNNNNNNKHYILKKTPGTDAFLEIWNNDFTSVSTFITDHTQIGADGIGAYNGLLGVYDDNHQYIGVDTGTATVIEVSCVSYKWKFRLY